MQKFGRSALIARVISNTNLGVRRIASGVRTGGSLKMSSCDSLVCGSDHPEHANTNPRRWDDDDILLIIIDGVLVDSCPKNLAQDCRVCTA